MCFSLQVCAVHTIQALVKGSSLGLTILQYAPEITMLSLTLLSSPCWAMRNAALQLYSMPLYLHLINSSCRSLHYVIFSAPLANRNDPYVSNAVTFHRDVIRHPGFLAEAFLCFTSSFCFVPKVLSAPGCWVRGLLVMMSLLSMACPPRPFLSIILH